jgi:Holliday junction resolvase
MRERDVERYLVEKIRALGGRAYKWVSPSQRGVPDRLCVLPGGRVLAVEVKRPGGKVTRLQERELAQLNALGMQAAVVDSIESVEKLCKELS